VHAEEHSAGPNPISHSQSQRILATLWHPSRPWPIAMVQLHQHYLYMKMWMSRAPNPLSAGYHILCSCLLKTGQRAEIIHCCSFHWPCQSL